MRNEEEYYECLALVDYLEILKIQGNDVIYSHIPNETYTTSWNQKRKNKAVGVNAGIPDYLLVINNTLIFIEMKKLRKILKNGNMSKEDLLRENQKIWLEKINGTGNEAFVCYGFDEAKKVIDKLIK